MHTFEGPNGTRIHYSSDVSGSASILVHSNGAGHHTHDVDCADLLAFADYVRAERFRSAKEEVFARRAGLLSELKDGAAPDRERREFIRRAAIVMATMTEPSPGGPVPMWTEQGCVNRAQMLWEALQQAGY